MNNLPEALHDVEGTPPRGKNSQQAAALVVKKFPRGGVEQLRSQATSSHLVTVSSELIDAVAAFVTEYKEGETRGLLRDAAAVLGRLDETDPALAPWRAARKFAMTKTHLDTSLVSEPPSDDEILRNLEIIEVALSGRVGYFFDNKHSLEDLLRDANDTSGGEGQ